jgi:hypothetical protein
MVRAAAIRDHVLPLLRSRGRAHRYGRLGGAGPLHLTTWEDGPFRFVLREPYRPLGAGAGWTAAPVARAAPPPFGLDVERGARLVLSAAWDPDGAVELVAFRPGAWEREVLALR